MRAGRILFRVGAGILILGATLHVATLWPRVAGIAATLPERTWLIVAGFVVSALTALLACALAALLLWKAADRADARALTLFLGFLAVFWGSLFRFMNITGDGDSISATLSYGGNLVSQSALVALLLAGAAFLRFAALFPRPLTAERLPPARRWPVLRRIRAATLRPLTISIMVAVVIAAELWLTDLVAMFVPDGVEADAWLPIRVSLFIWISAYLLFLLFAVVAGLRNLRTSFRIGSREERSRMLWLLSGFTIATWMVVGAIGITLLIATTNLSANALGAAVPLALFLAPLVVVVCAAVGVLYSGAIDSALVLQKSTIYGALGAVAVVTFAGIENVLSNVIEERLGLPGIVGAMVAGALVTGALIPVRNLLLRRVPSRAPATAAAEPEDAPASPASTRI